MIELLRPGFLVAGAAVALLAVGLHLLRPRIRERRALPTARFLEPDPRSRIRWHRRPDHPALLALRVAFALALGAGFAGVVWVGPTEGLGVVVVVDSEADADSAALEARARSLTAPGELPLELRRVERGADGVLSLGTFLQALHREASAIRGVDSVTAVMMVQPRAELWRPGVPELREHIWPGRIRYEALAFPEPAGERGEIDLEAVIREPGEDRTGGAGLDGDVDSGPVEFQPPSSLAPEERERWLRQWEALPEWSRRMEGDRREEAAPAPLLEMEVEFVGALPEDWRVEDTPLWERDGAGVEPGSGLPEAAESGGEGGELLFLDGRRVAGGGARVEGMPADGVTIPLLRAGGHPAGAAHSRDGVCRVALALTPNAPALSDSRLSSILESVAREGCGLGPRLSAVEVDRALRALLDRAELPDAVALSDLEGRTPAGRDLGPWLLALAFLLAGGEWLRVRGLDRARGLEGTNDPPTPDSPEPAS